MPAAFDIEAVPSALCRLGADGSVDICNSLFADLLRLPVQAIAGSTFADIVYEEDRDRFSALLETMHSGAHHRGSCELRLMPATGNSIWVSATAAPAPDFGIFVQITDIDHLIRVTDALKKNESRWRYALESAHQGVWDHDFKSGELFYSRHWRAIRGLADDAVVDGELETWIESVHPADRAHVLEYIRRQDEGEADFNTFEYRERHADGHWVWIESRGASVEWDRQGKPARIIGTDTDITDRKKAEARLEEVTRRLRLAIDVSSIGVFEANLDTGDVFRDDQLLRIYGLDDADSALQDRAFEDRLHPEDREEAFLTVQHGTASGKPFFNSFRIIRPDGEIRHVRSRSMTYTNMDGHRILIGANWDVTEDVTLNDELDRARRLAEARSIKLERARSRIEYNALHDHLTGLPNRRYLDQKIDEWVSGKLHYCAILHIDLDRFKQINDTLGHQAGDAMLVHTAGVLEALVGTKDFVARIGGDEFLVLCSLRQNQQDVTTLAGRIIDALREPVPFENHLCRFGASIGVAWAPDEPSEAKHSLINADIALYRAKGLGRNRYALFTQQLQTEIRHLKQTADEISHGLEERQFVPVYQPQFDARTHEVVAVETLARWRHPTRGILTPDYFLKIAEDISVLNSIDRSIAEQALEDFSDWEKLGHPVPRISVNVSSWRLREPDLVESLRSMVIPKGRLSFELLESIFLDDLDQQVTQTLNDLKTLGIDVEIDDFGTGHASIVGLMKLNPSRLKIDRALVKPLTETVEQRRLVGSIIDIGHSLNIAVVAEGVETMEHAAILRDLNCDILQGYALARPMFKEQMDAFLEKRP